MKKIITYYLITYFLICILGCTGDNNHESENKIKYKIECFPPGTADISYQDKYGQQYLIAVDLTKPWLKNFDVEYGDYYYLSIENLSYFYSSFLNFIEISDGNVYISLSIYLNNSLIKKEYRSYNWSDQNRYSLFNKFEINGHI